MKTEELWVECGDARLYGLLHVPDRVPAPALLILHGMNSQGFHFLRIYSYLAKAAVEKGFVTFIFDFRGAGRSTGKFDYGVQEQQDVRCALNYLASRREVQSNSIFVVGHSLGGAVSLYALQGESRVKGLVLWSTPKNHNYNVRKFIRRTRGTLSLYSFLILSRLDRLVNVSRFFKLEVYGIRLRPKHVREKLMRLDECEAASKFESIPLLVVIGDKDTIVGVDEAQAIYESAHEPKDLLVIEGADHIYLGKEKELVDRTLEWLEQRK